MNESVALRKGAVVCIVSFDTAGFKRGHRLWYLTNSKSRRECPNNDLSKFAYDSHREEVVTGNATPFK